MKYLKIAYADEWNDVKFVACLYACTLQLLKSNTEQHLLHVLLRCYAALLYDAV